MKTLTTWLLVALLAGACGKKEDDELEGNVNMELMKGTWNTSCAQTDSGFEMKSMSFAKDDFTYMSAVYSDETCTTLDNYIAGRGNFLLVSLVEIAGLGTATEIDYTYLELEWTFVADPSTAADYAVVCDSTDAAGTVDLLDKTCAITSEISVTFPAESFGTIMFEVEKLLLTDLNSNGATLEARSKNLVKETGWTKQPEEEEGAQ